MEKTPPLARLFIILLWVFLLKAYRLYGQDAPIFQPVQPQKEIRAMETGQNLRIDGRLDEADWQRAQRGSGFFQAQPEQGKPLTFDTRMQVLFNRKFLYVGAFCPDSAGRKGIRVPDLRRDCDYFSNSNAQQQLQNNGQRTDLNRQQQVIGKLTYLKQF